MNENECYTEENLKDKNHGLNPIVKVTKITKNDLNKLYSGCNTSPYERKSNDISNIRIQEPRSVSTNEYNSTR